MSKKETPIKNLDYYKRNAEEDYINTPISVLRYITELENNANQKVLEASEEVKNKCKNNACFIRDDEINDRYARAAYRDVC